MGIWKYNVKIGAIRMSLSSLTVCSGGGGLPRETLDLKYLGSTNSPATSSGPKLKFVHAKVTRIKGPYDVRPTATLLAICQADFEVTRGSIPKYASVTQAHVDFFQGDEMAALLKKSKELTLIFDGNGKLAGVQQ